MGAEEANDVVELDVSKEPEYDKSNDRFPPSSKFIMWNEMCERFSYYGLTAILPLYLSNVLDLGQNKATMIMNVFSGCCYITALYGGYLSDAVIGKYNTVLYVSLIYCAGGIFLSVTAIPGLLGTPPNPWGMSVGLALIALGTGGIKPVVSAFLGDQFKPEQAHLLERMFRVFYFVINLGSVFSTILTPIIRSNVNYAAAFGVPTGLLLVATTIFFSGRNRYVRQKPKGSVLKDTIKCIAHAVVVRVQEGRDTLAKDESFLFLAKDEYPADFIRDVVAALQVLLVFGPIIVFWALYNQCSVRWIFQSELMDRKIGAVTVTPDQVPVLNPICILFLIPIYDKIIYPTIQKWRPFPQVARIAVGFVLLGVSFVIAGFVQIAIVNSAKESVSVFLQIPQYLLYSMGEVMVSITGLEFAYTQAPKTMKSIMMAGWLIATAIGNYASAAIAASPLNDTKNYFMYAGLEAVGTILFIIVAIYHTRNYVNPNDAVAYQDLKEQMSSNALNASQNIGGQMGANPLNNPNLG